MHTTNSPATFITIAPDSVATTGIVPSKPDSIAGRHYAFLHDKPYEMTSDDLLFAVHADRANLPVTAENRAAFFANPKACLRASPLPKQFGWGIHHDGQGRIAIYAVGTDDYARLSSDDHVKVTPAMRTKRT